MCGKTGFEVLPSKLVQHSAKAWVQSLQEQKRRHGMEGICR